MSKSLLRSSFLFSSITLVSRILGFCRDMACAYVFGVTPALDAFIVAYRIPNLMRRLFAEGAFSQAFVPVISEYKVTHTHEEVKDFLACISGCLGLVVIVVCFLGVLAASPIIKTIAAGFAADGVRSILATDMLRITFPYLFFITLTALGGCVLNSYDKFAASAAAPIIYNIAIIIGSYFFAKSFAIPEMVLPYAVIAGGVTQYLFISYTQRRVNLFVWPKINWKHPAVVKVLKLMLPAMYGAAAGQINLLVDSIFASFLVAGSISWLFFADRLMEFPLGIFGVSLGTVILPRLAKELAKKRHDNYANTLDWGVRLVFLVGMPSAIGLYMLAGPIIATLFMSGRFNSHDVLMSQHSLMAYTLAILGIMFTKVFAAAFYARREIYTPVKISTICIVVNIVLNAALIKSLAHVGLALATSISAVINALLLYVVLHKKAYYVFGTDTKVLFLRVTIASFFMWLLLYYFTPANAEWFAFTKVIKIKTLVLLIMSGFVVYVGVLYFVGLKPRHMLAAVSDSG